MNIYVTHSTNFDYKNELYAPLKNSSLMSEHIITFPHENELISNSIEMIKKANIIIAEVSYPSTGQGIELGWAYIFDVPIMAIYKEDKLISESIKLVSKAVHSYKDSTDMVSKITTFLQKNI